VTREIERELVPSLNRVITSNRALWKVIVQLSLLDDKLHYQVPLRPLLAESGPLISTFSRDPNVCFWEKQTSAITNQEAEIGHLDYGT